MIGLFMGLLAVSRLPAPAATVAGKWPRAAVDFLVLPAADPLRKLSARLPGIAPEAAAGPMSDADLRAQLAWAYRENDLLKAQLRTEREAVAWFGQIRAFVKFEDVKLVSAGVAAGNVDPERPLLTLSSGSKAGLAPHQVVVGAGAELVGVIEDSVGPYSCRVRAFSWPKTAIDCRIVSAKHEGEGIPVRLRANDKGTAFECDVGIDQKVGIGDVAVFDDTGFGGHARGFVVGKVAECLDLSQINRDGVFENDGRRAADAQLAKDLDKAIFYKRLVVRPANNLTRLDRVIVLVPTSAQTPDAPPPADAAVPKPAATAPGPETRKEAKP